MTFRELNSSFFLKMVQKFFFCLFFLFSFLMMQYETNINFKNLARFKKDFKKIFVFLCYEYKSVNQHALLCPNKGVLYHVLMAVRSVTYWSWHTQSLYLLLRFCFWVLQALRPHKGLACVAGPLLVPPLLLNISLVSPKWQKIEKALLAVTSEKKRMVGVVRPQSCENDG